MSRSGVNLNTDDPVAPGLDPDPPLPEARRLPPPLTGALIYAGLRVLGVVIAAFLLRRGRYRRRHWSLLRLLRAADGGHYEAIAGPRIDAFEADTRQRLRIGDRTPQQTACSGQHHGLPAPHCRYFSEPKAA